MSKSVPIPNKMRIRSGNNGSCTVDSNRRFFPMLWLAMLFSIASISNSYGTQMQLNMSDDSPNSVERQADIVSASSNAACNSLTINVLPPPIGISDDLRNTPDANEVYNEVTVETTAAQAPAQKQNHFSGKVVAATGEPLAGVTVMEKDTKNGVTSVADGSFLINLTNPNATVVFSIVGYETVEMKPAGRNAVTVTMTKTVTKMDEVIVVAYGLQNKSSVTGAIATINPGELNTVSTPNVNAMLQAKVAGVQVTNTSGRPGEPAKIRIRGKSSLGGESTSDPLWVIDGVISGTGSQLNPSDIQSISLLKDASATALYGSRATNGVILVTTKSGRLGENKVDVNVKFGIAQQKLGRFKLMNSEQLYDYTMSMDRLPEDPWLYDRETVLSHDTDWFDFATQNGYSSNYMIAHTMGTEKIRNYLSGDYYRETGTVRGYTFERFTVRDNVDLQVTNRLNLHFKVAGSYQEIENRQHSLTSAMTYLPWDYPYNPNGSIRTGREDDWHGRDAINYLYNNSLNWGRTKQLGVNGTFGFDYSITDWLTFESNNNIGFRYNRNENYEDPKATGASEYNGSIANDVYMVTTRYTSQLLRLNYLFNQVHQFNAFLGYEFSDYFYENTSATGRSIPAGTEVLGVAADPYLVGGTKYGNAMQSVFFNTNYTYNDRYNAQFSFRRDGSSKFGPENRYGNFWTFGLAWTIDKEEFMQEVKWVDYLKLRGSYGLIGNQSSLGNYSFMSTYTLTLDYNGIKAAFPYMKSNSELTWEKCYEGNIAIDARLFNRLSMTIDFYNKNTSGLLYYQQLTSLTGFNGMYCNIGALRNRGIEITLSPDLVMTKDIQWTMDFNFGLNRNKVTALANENADQISGNYIFRVGNDRDTYYLPEWAGVDIYNGEPLWYHVSETGEKTLTSDYNNASKVAAGSAAPKWFGGIGTTASYKSFTLSALANFVYGNKIYHYAREFYDNDGAYPTYNSLSIDSGPNWKRWEQPGDIATHPKAVWGGNNLSNKTSTRYLEDGSYFRLVNVTLSYDLPQHWLNKIRIKNAQVFLSGENLFTITNFSGNDPEAGIGNSTGNADLEVYPLSRRISFGLNVSF